ncbi:MAG: hypothetical protein ACOZQL_14860 [Myxococcota bacterium]
MKVLLNRPELLVAERAHLVVLLMREPPDDRAFEDCGRLVLEVMERQAPVSVLVYIPKLGGPLRPLNASRENQKAFIDLFTREAARYLGTAIVVRAGGLAGQMIRMTVNGIVMLSSLPRPLRVFGNLADGVGFLETLPHQRAELKDSAQLLEELTALPE